MPDPRGKSFFAPRMSRFAPSPSQLAAVRARELIAAGRDIVKLTTGEPDFPTPDAAKQAAVACMAADEIRYTPVNGTLEMRQAIQHKFRRDNSLDFGLDQITVGSGAKQILFNAWMATLHMGDEVIIPSPYWTAYPDMVQLAGGQPVIVPTQQSQKFKLQPQALAAAITEKTKWLVFSSPGNPTGATYSADQIRELCEVLLDAPHVHILCDDVYEHLVFDNNSFASLATVEPRLADRTLTCNSVSKGWSMTGWRVGFAGGPVDIIGQMSKMQSQSTSGISAVSQAAAIAALQSPIEEVQARTSDLQKRRDILFEQLNSIDGLTCDLPEGAMYIYCSCDDVIGKTTPDGQVIEDDRTFAMYLLDSVGVAVVHGEAYGMSPAFRACFVASEQDLVRGGQRIRQACESLR